MPQEQTTPTTPTEQQTTPSTDTNPAPPQDEDAGEQDVPLTMEAVKDWDDEEKAEPPKEEAKEGEGEKGKAEPVTVEALKELVPEGAQVDEGLAKEFIEVLNGEGTPAERAKALMELHTRALTAAEQAQTQAWADVNAKWLEEIKTDPVIGGQHLEETRSQVAKVMDKYGSPELKEMLALTGAGNSKAMVEFVLKVAADVVEGKPVSGNAAPAAGGDTASLLFPSMAKEQK